MLTAFTTVTRTKKTGDRDHVGLANGTAAPEEHLPRYFGKAGYSGNDPATTKKQGGGKGNWYVHFTSLPRLNQPSIPRLLLYVLLLTDISSRGRSGVSELEDYDYNPAKPRRRTNSFSQAAGHSALKTKFEALDPEVIEYEEDLHGPSAGDLADHNELEKMSTSSSADTMGSVDEEEMAGTVAAAGLEEKK